MSRYVWISESGGYDSYIELVADTLEAAVEGVKRTFTAPYIVKWQPLFIRDEETATLTGHFESVPGFSTRHEHQSDFRRFEVFELRSETPSPK